MDAMYGGRSGDKKKNNNNILSGLTERCDNTVMRSDKACLVSTAFCMDFIGAVRSDRQV